MRNKKCPWHNKCRNGGDGCSHHNPEKCVRFLPLEGTNLTEVVFTVETQPHIDSYALSEMLTNWFDCMGWSYCGTTKPYEDEEIVHNHTYVDGDYNFEVGV